MKGAHCCISDSAVHGWASTDASAPTHEHASHHPHTRARTAGGALGPHHNKHSWDQSAVWRAHERAIMWPGSVGDRLTSADAPTSHMHWCLTS